MFSFTPQLLTKVPCRFWKSNRCPFFPIRTDLTKKRANSGTLVLLKEGCSPQWVSPGWELLSTRNASFHTMTHDK